MIMSEILIKGMEMPEFCYGCPLHNSEYGYCNILDRATIDPPRGCPLSEVKPHGRLIDADEFSCVLSQQLELISKLSNKEDSLVYDTIRIIKKMLEDAPTVLEASE